MMMVMMMMMKKTTWTRYAFEKDFHRSIEKIENKTKIINLR